MAVWYTLYKQKSASSPIASESASCYFSLESGLMNYSVQEPWLLINTFTLAIQHRESFLCDKILQSYVGHDALGRRYEYIRMKRCLFLTCCLSL